MLEMPTRWWEPGGEDAPDVVLPEDEWIPENEELPFE